MPLLLPADPASRKKLWKEAVQLLDDARPRMVKPTTRYRSTQFYNRIPWIPQWWWDMLLEHTRNTQTHTQTNKRTNERTNKQTTKQASKQTNTHTAHAQAQTQTNTNTHTNTCTGYSVYIYILYLYYNGSHRLQELMNLYPGPGSGERQSGPELHYQCLQCRCAMAGGAALHPRNGTKSAGYIEPKEHWSDITIVINNNNSNNTHTHIHIYIYIKSHIIVIELRKFISSCFYDIISYHRVIEYHII